ncbi:MAG TPA: chemotaxis response regulator protein-glutamate methylesterase [bacterium]
MSAVRVLVVDDSALMRRLVPQLLSGDPGIEVVGTAMDGVHALRKVAALAPDVLTLDVDMPRMDGIETLRALREANGPPAVVLSSLTRRDADLAFRALAAGAFDVVAKPHAAISTHIHEIAAELVAKIKAAAGARAVALAPPLPAAVPAPSAVPATAAGRQRAAAERVLAIGVSTGGPNALTYLLPQLPADFPAATLVVQHLPPGFTAMFAARLNAASRLEVREARDGDLVGPGRVLIAPGDRHLRVTRGALGAIAVLSDAPPARGHRPSADVLFASVAEEFGAAATGLIMTGMGDDGAAGLARIRQRGGRTLAQDERSCVVFGMPRAAIESGAVDEVVALAELPRYLRRHYEQGREVA